MKTILYNTTTEEATHFANGYSIDGELQPLGQLTDNIWHLERILNLSPSYNRVTQFLTNEWLPNFTTNQYVQVWTIHDKPEEEVAEYLNKLSENHLSGVKYDLMQKQADEAYTQRLTELSAFDDTAALDVASEYEPFVIGKDYKGENQAQGIKADRFFYPVDGKLYKVLQDHTSAAQWLPGEAVSLYVEVVPPGKAVPWNVNDYASYELGTIVTHNGHKWECINPTYAWIEPGSQDSHYGWTDLGAV